MTGSPGEMAFLDHLEELRWRILRSLAAIVVGFGIGLWAVQRFQLVTLLKVPIAPYLTGGKLVVTSPTEPVLIVFKLGFLVGLVLASPIILWQTWAFLAPALYEREKRALVPALFAGLVLFLTGAVVAYLLVLPRALRVLFSFQTEAIAPFITYDAYFGFVLQIVLALGVSFELPLGMMLLAFLGVVGPAEMSRFRRYAIVLAFIAGAFLSPGTELVSMIMMTIPLLLLYEVGLAGSVIIHRRRRRAALAAAALLLLGVAGPGRAEAQQVPGRPPSAVARDSAGALGDSARARLDSGRVGADSGGVATGQPLDTATARRLGLPTAPTRGFAEPDSVVRALLNRRGYQSTRYRADSATLFADEQRIVLQGRALTQRQGSMLEAETIRYLRSSCVLDAAGDPHLFDRGQVLVGKGIRYDTCIRRGVINGALTNFNEGSTVWFLRGNVSADSSASRIYAASSEITSCDLPTPHYHFAARSVKWVSRNMLVARPVVLYVRDVPILWLPFVFQDTRPGRRSGILIPQFGLNDLVRPTRSYNRQITNIGYYWAPNDYWDLTARLDWYSNRYVQYGLSGQYRWLDRFLSGSVGFNEQHQVGGSSSTVLRWDHRQNFDLSTSLNFSLNYASNTAIVRDNAIDPLLNTQQITSSLNFSKQYDWGTVSLGGNRRQDLSDRSVQQLLPALTVSPAPIALGSNVTWSPGLSLTNNTTSNTQLPGVVRILPGGLLDTVDQSGSSRTTALNLDTPLRLGSFNWQNSVQVTDQVTNGRDSVVFNVPNQNTPDPADSVSVTRVFPGQFESGIDWDTGINLPILFRGSWKLQPSVGIANSTAGPFAIRNRNTNGSFVRQGKRFQFGATASPTVFAFFPGIGALSRIRHSVSPVITFNYAPAAGVPEEYARAVAQPGQPLLLRSDPTQTVSLSLSQVFEGKARPVRVAPARAAPVQGAPGRGDPTRTAAGRGALARGDSVVADAGSDPEAEARKYRLLSINTSALSYDFEQAKKPGRTGWVTPSITNSFLSDLLPGFNLSLTHDLWRGEVGSDTADFDPFLTTVNASFAISGNTICAVGRIVGLCRRGARPSDGRREVVPASYVADAGRRRPGSFYSTDQLPVNRAGRAFTANFNYSLGRTRPIPGQPDAGDRQSLGFSTGFSPTPFWSLSWSAQYNITDSKFESQVVRLERDLHEWRAGFNFVRNANGNFAFYFSIYLTDLPDLKFDYNQATFEQ